MRVAFGGRVVAALAVGTLLTVAFLGAPRAAQATILSGCVAPEDAGVAHLVGWVDVGVLLGVGDPEPPALLQVIAPDGSVTDYRDGDGLTTPTGSLPIWFARAEQTGDYQVVINGEERCTIHVGDELSSVPTEPPEFRRQASNGLNWWLTIGGLIVGAALGFTFARRKQSV